MTVLRAWAPLFWSGVLVGLVHTIVDTLGADPPAAIVYGSGVLLAASAVPVLIGLVHGLVVARRAGAEDRAGDPRLAPVARLVAGRVRGAVAVLIEPERRTEGSWGTSGTDRPLDPDTRFEIGSVTKTFTAICSPRWSAAATSRSTIAWPSTSPACPPRARARRSRSSTSPRIPGECRGCRGT